MEYAFFDQVTAGKSLVVSGAFFDSDARTIELGLMAVFILLLALPLSTLLGWGFEMMAENSRAYRTLLAARDRRAPLVPRLTSRRNQRLQDAGAINQQVQDQVSGVDTLRRRLNALKATRDQLVREIGEDTAGTSRYVFTVSNRYVLAHISRGQQHPLLDASWQSGQLVEVWASSLIEARLAVIERYPTTFGFAVEKQEARADGQKAVPERA